MRGSLGGAIGPPTRTGATRVGPTCPGAGKVRAARDACTTGIETEGATGGAGGSFGAGNDTGWGGAGCPNTGCPAPGWPETGCVTTGCVETGCVTTGCVTTGSVETGCVTTGCVETGCVTTGCVTTGSVETGWAGGVAATTRGGSSVSGST